MKIHTAHLIDRKGWRPGWKKSPFINRSLCGAIKDGVSTGSTVAEQNCKRCLLRAQLLRNK